MCEDIQSSCECTVSHLKHTLDLKKSQKNERTHLVETYYIKQGMFKQMHLHDLHKRHMNTHGKA